MIRGDRYRASDPASARFVYVKTLSGHKQSYLDLLGEMFSLTQTKGTMSIRLFVRFVKAERVLFATLDEHMFSFAAIAAARSVLGRPTAALFLRPHKCFDETKYRYRIKRLAFRALRKLPKLTMATITQFDFAPNYAEVAHAGICDPQLWDLCDGKHIRRPNESGLSREIATLAAGRQICVALGQLGHDKGTAFLTSLLSHNPEIISHMLFVCAGPVPDHADSIAASLRAKGAIVVDRFISDAELESLYGIAAFIWACYSPNYDQASGVFGRALQLGVPVIVREGSLVASIAAHTGIAHAAVPFNDVTRLYECFTSARAPTGIDSTRITALVGAWRSEFKAIVGDGLTGCSFRKSVIK